MGETGLATSRATLFLDRLRGEFPIEARVARATAPARQTYSRILVRWLEADKPPAASEFPERDLAELVGLDAVALSDQGVSAYPFSARDTGISVKLHGRRVGVMCAIDALAVPMLSGSTVMIEATCERCRKPISLEARADGGWSTAATSAVRVHHPSRRDLGSPCCVDLCPTIRFVFAGCETGRSDEYLDLDDAISVARGMFGFQAAMIREERQRLANLGEAGVTG